MIQLRLRGSFRFQIRQDVHVAVGLREALALHGFDSLQQLEGRLGAGEPVGVRGRWFALGEGKTVGADAEAHEAGAGTYRSLPSPPTRTRLISWIICERGG